LALAAAAHAETPWERYLEEPSPENAKEVLRVEYEGSQDPYYWELDLMLLEVQVISSDPEAVRLAHRLLAESDGHSGEMLCIMLGRLIRIDPEMYLSELQASGGIEGRARCSLGMLGPEYIDRREAMAFETRERIRALESVSLPSLAPLRSGCLELLGEKLEYLED